MTFRWNSWNVEHIERHGVEPQEAERVIAHSTSPYPLRHGQDKWLAIGRGKGGRWLQVVFVLDPDEVIFVIHARPLEPQEIRRYRRRMSR